MPSSSNIVGYIDRLSAALVETAADKRIGAPRFVRWLDRAGEDESVIDSIASGIEVCNRLFDSLPVREERSGDDVLHATVHAVWANGASALVSAGPAGTQSGAGPEIMLLGSSGAIYFDGALGGGATVEQVGQQ
jgi:hypothetical protein